MGISLDYHWYYLVKSKKCLLTKFTNFTRTLTHHLLHTCQSGTSSCSPTFDSCRRLHHHGRLLRHPRQIGSLVFRPVFRLLSSVLSIPRPLRKAWGTCFHEGGGTIQIKGRTCLASIEGHACLASIKGHTCLASMKGYTCLASHHGRLGKTLKDS